MGGEHDHRAVRMAVAEAGGRSERSDEFDWDAWGGRIQRTTLIGRTFLLGLAAALIAQAVAMTVRWLRRPLGD